MKIKSLLLVTVGLAGLIWSTSSMDGQNTAYGSGALMGVTTGLYDSAFGYAAAGSISGGFNNTAVGYFALVNPLSSDGDTAVGSLSLESEDTGDNNTALGFLSLSNNTSGARNIGIGYEGGRRITTGSDNICIGNVGIASDTDTIRIGTPGTQSATYVAGIYGTTATSGIEVYIDSVGQLGTATSSARFKRDIHDMDDASDVLLALHPVTFRYKSDIDPKGTPQFGLVAEDVEKVDPELVARDDKNQIYSVRYQAVNAMLLNEFIRQHRLMEEQKVAIATLEEKATKLDNLEKRLNDMETALHTVEKEK